MQQCVGLFLFCVLTQQTYGSIEFLREDQHGKETGDGSKLDG